MKKLVRYGLLLFVLSLIGFTMIVMFPGSLFAYEEDVDPAEEEGSLAYTYEERLAAIRAADGAILQIPPPSQIIALDQTGARKVAEARALVERAKDLYHATDYEFTHLGRLLEAEQQINKLLAVQAAKDAIDLIPPKTEIREEHRHLIEEARRLVNYAMQVYGATYFDLCWRIRALEDAEDIIGPRPIPDREPEPRPQPRPEPNGPRPTPPTGQGLVLPVLGLALAGMGSLFLAGRRRKKTGR